MVFAGQLVVVMQWWRASSMIMIRLFVFSSTSVFVWREAAVPRRGQMGKKFSSRKCSTIKSNLG